MIYPKAIFRTVIALSTVAAASQATAVSPRYSSTGAKRGKGGRYVDTTTNAYGATGTDVLPVGYPAGYAPTGVNVQAGASLRKITSPNNVGVQFSAASPSNVAVPTKGTAGYVNLAANNYGSPRSLDNNKNAKGGVEGGKKTSANYGTPAAPAPPAKGGSYGAKIPIAPSSGGVKIGGNSGISPSSGGYKGAKDAKGGYGAKADEVRNYGRDPSNGDFKRDNKSGNYGKSDNGGKGIEFPVSPSSGGYTNGKGGKNNYVAAPPAPITGATGGSRQGSRGGYKTDPVPAPNSPTKGSLRSKSGSAVGGSKSTNPTPSSPTDNGPKGGQGGYNTGITSPVPAPYGPTPTGNGPKGGQSGPAASSPIVNQGGAATSKGAYSGNGSGSKGGSTAGSKASTTAPATIAPTPAMNAPAPATQYKAKQSSTKYAKQSGRK